MRNMLETVTVALMGAVAWLLAGVAVILSLTVLVGIDVSGQAQTMIVALTATGGAIAAVAVYWRS